MRMVPWEKARSQRLARRLLTRYMLATYARRNTNSGKELKTYAL